jgi:hypothetical protein
MKKRFAIILSLAVLTGLIGLSLTSEASAKPVDPSVISHTQERFCGNHCHHHCHDWRCGGRTYHCNGHD